VFHTTKLKLQHYSRPHSWRRGLLTSFFSLAKFHWPEQKTTHGQRDAEHESEERWLEGPYCNEEEFSSNNLAKLLEI